MEESRQGAPVAAAKGRWQRLMQEHGPTQCVKMADLLAAWRVLENLTVSLDQIGGFFGSTDDAGMREALDKYLTPEVFAAIADARHHLGLYIPDKEAEEISETIPYWNYGKRQPVPEAVKSSK